MAEDDESNEAGGQSTNSRSVEAWGIGLSLGVGVGVAMGLALENTALGIGIGVALGVAFAVAFGAKERRPRDGAESDAPDRPAS